MDNEVMRLGLVVVVGLLCACTKDNPKSCVDDGFCTDPALPFCDVDGSLGGLPGACVAVSCTPLAFQSCRGDDALVCNTSGNDFDIAHCDFGCEASTGGCNKHIVPKYLPEACDRSASDDLLISSDTMLTTDDDAQCNGGIVDQLDGPDICVLRYATITIARFSSLSATGTRALALVADDALTIDGVLDVSANGFTSGPGGGFIASGGVRDLPDGCGGAGFQTAGGAGGTATTDGGAMNGGASAMNPSLLVELVGGTRANFEPAVSADAGVQVEHSHSFRVAIRSQYPGQSTLEEVVVPAERSSPRRTVVVPAATWSCKA
jgi:hypothetical protein